MMGNRWDTVQDRQPRIQFLIFYTKKIREFTIYHDNDLMFTLKFRFLTVKNGLKICGIFYQIFSQRSLRNYIYFNYLCKKLIRLLLFFKALNFKNNLKTKIKRHEDALETTQKVKHYLFPAKYGLCWNLNVQI